MPDAARARAAALLADLKKRARPGDAVDARPATRRPGDRRRNPHQPHRSPELLDVRHRLGRAAAARCSDDGRHRDEPPVTAGCDRRARPYRRASLHTRSVTTTGASPRRARRWPITCSFALEFPISGSSGSRASPTIASRTRPSRLRRQTVASRSCSGRRSIEAALCFGPRRASFDGACRGRDRTRQDLRHGRRTAADPDAHRQRRQVRLPRSARPTESAGRSHRGRQAGDVARQTRSGFVWSSTY